MTDHHLKDTPGAGRPTDYRIEFCDSGKTLAMLGATDVEIADALDVHVSTYYRWRAQHSDFREAVKLGKECADERVEASLYHRAVGYTYDSEELRVLRDGEVVRLPIRKHVPPDTGAAMNWLKNRVPNKWRDKVDHEHSGVVRQITKVETVIIDPNVRRQ
jgi:hypothetical protein